MQDLIVYIIILGAISYTIISTMKKVLLAVKRSSNQATLCNGCSGCSLSNNGASCNTILKQIEKFKKE